MSCREIEEKLLGGLETRMDPAVWEHLRHCASCQELQRELEEIEDLYRTLARTEKAPLDFACRIIPRVSRSQHLRAPLIACSVAVAALAAALFLAPSSSGGGSTVATIPAGQASTYEARPVEFNLDSPQTQIFLLDPAQQQSDSVKTRQPRQADRVEDALLKHVSH